MASAKNKATARIGVEFGNLVPGRDPMRGTSFGTRVTQG